jgi:transcriptional regulator with XRE-family HTH domain
MKQNNSCTRPNIGQRLALLRYQYNYPLEEMARKLGLSRSGYFKNENGITLPKLETLQRLEKEFDISMDWLLFAKGPIHYQDVLAGKGTKTKSFSLEKSTPEVTTLLEFMEQDVLFRHEVLVFFYKYKNKLPGLQEQGPETASGQK